MSNHDIISIAMPCVCFLVRAEALGMSERKSCVSASSDESVKCGNKKRVSPLEAKINQYANKGLVCTEHSLALLHDRKSKR